MLYIPNRLGKDECFTGFNPWIILGSVALLLVCVVSLTITRATKSHPSQVPVVVAQDLLQVAPVVSDKSQLPQPQIQPQPQQQVQVVAPQHTMVIRNRGSLVGVFKRYGFDAKLASSIISINKHSRLLQHLQKGGKISIWANGPDVQKIEYFINDSDTLFVTKNASGQGYQANLHHVEPVSRLEYVAATVHGSVYSVAKKAGISPKIMSQFVNIFSNKLNVAKDIRNGDKIALFYKAYYLNNKRVKVGEIAAAEIIHKDKIHRAIAFTDPHGGTEYYTPEGYSLKAAFLRYPLKFKRISSHFSLNRFHPILRFVRAHLGVDFAANIGTPVAATSNGRIAFMGRRAGHGNAVVVQKGRYSTLYAHLARFPKGLVVGKSVKQGQVIGYVGSSGLSSGPHLHYEFCINGVHHDPLKVKLPVGDMIERSYRKQFLARSRALVAQLDLRHKLLLAMK